MNLKFIKVEIYFEQYKTSSESYQSYSINYKGGDVSSSFAVDNGLKGFESRRFALVYPHNKSTLEYCCKIQKILIL